MHRNAYIFFKVLRVSHASLPLIQTFILYALNFMLPTCIWKVLLYLLEVNSITQSLPASWFFTVNKKIQDLKFRSLKSQGIQQIPASNLSFHTSEWEFLLFILVFVSLPQPTLLLLLKIPFLSVRTSTETTKKLLKEVAKEQELDSIGILLNLKWVYKTTWRFIEWLNTVALNCSFLMKTQWNVVLLRPWTTAQITTRFWFQLWSIRSSFLYFAKTFSNTSYFPNSKHHSS